MNDNNTPKAENRKVDELSDELDIEALRDFLKNGNHEYSTAQNRLCFAIIARIYRRLMQGYRFEAIRISEREMIVNGNHRYIAHKLARVEIEIIEATRSHSDKPRSFKEVAIDSDQDWDLNNPLTEKYCSDDFLISENYVKFKNK